MVYDLLRILLPTLIRPVAVFASRRLSFHRPAVLFRLPCQLWSLLWILFNHRYTYWYRFGKTKNRILLRVMPDAPQAPALSLALKITQVPLLAVAFFGWRTVICWLAENNVPHVLQDQAGLHTRLLGRNLKRPYPLPDLLVLVDRQSPNGFS
jgi:hypothetical protein